MAVPFLEERIDICARYGSGFESGFDVSHTEDAVGNSYSRLLSPFPRLRYDLSFANADQDGLAKRIADLFMRCAGTYSGFRVKHFAEYTTNGYTLPPTHNDQLLLSLGENRYQLISWYGQQNAATTPRRLIKKPVIGSAKIGVAGVQITAGFTVNHATGIVTFDAPPNGVVTGGCEFDIPMRFSADYAGVFSNYKTVSTTVSLVEILNP